MSNSSTNQQKPSALPGSSFGSLWFSAISNSRLSDPFLPSGCWAKDQDLLIIIKAREGAFLIKDSGCDSSFPTACQPAVPGSAQMTLSPEPGTGFLEGIKGGKNAIKKSSTAFAERGRVKKSVIVHFNKGETQKMPFLLMLLRLKG